MNRNFIFVFILFATLFMVNADKTIKFNACPLPNITTLTVIIIPNPIIARKSVSFNVFAILNQNVTAGSTFLAVKFADSTGEKILTDVYFQVFTESIPAGSILSITAPSILAPDELPDVYTIGVLIADPIIGDPITPFKIYGCTYAVVSDVGTNTLASNDIFNDIL